MGMIPKKVGGISGLAIVLGAAMMVAQPGSAAVLDFLGMANSKEQGVELPLPSINPFTNAFVPIATSAFGFSGIAGQALASMGTAPVAYLDSNSAGMGVCKVVTDPGRQCAPSGDDNVQDGEVLGFVWGSDLRIDSVSLRGESHPSDPEFTTGEYISYSVDDGATWMSAQMVNARFGGSVAINAVVEAGKHLLFATGRVVNGAIEGEEQFYVSALTVSQVPLPAGVLLLGSALGSLGLMGRRRKAA